MILRVIPWEHPPADFEAFLWHGNQEQTIRDAPSAIHRPTHASLFRLEMDEETRRMLIEGNDLYLCIIGQVVPFCVGANLGEMLEMARRGV